MPGKSDVELEIRKFRKKLRQIENLERADKSLSEEERRKIERKFEIRSRLQELLSELLISEDEEEEDYNPHPEDIDMSADTTADLNISEDQPELEGGQQGSSCDTTETYIPTSNHGNDQADSSMSVDDSHIRVEGGGADGDQAPANLKHRSHDRDPTPDLTPQKKAKKEPTPSQGSPKKNKTQEKSKSAANKGSKEGESSWKTAKFTVDILEGHNDLICCADIAGDYVITGSRDTMVKIWHTRTRTEERSCGGHTGSVTSVFMLPPEDTAKLCGALGMEREDKLIVSGSLDCSIRLWAFSTGLCVKSIYTYNPITSMTYLHAAGLIVVGSGGGKVELWDAETGECVHSLSAHEDTVSALQSEGTAVYSSSHDGIIKVYELRERKLHVMFESENVKTISGSKWVGRPVRSMVSVGDKIFFGDDGMNVKKLDWKKGLVTKLANHQSEFGATDSLCVYDNILFSSGYDLDNGHGYINVRTFPQESYECTLDDDDGSRIMCMKCARNSEGHLVVVTGGFDLALWEQVKVNSRTRKDVDLVSSKFIKAYGKTPPPSDVESETDLSEGEAEGAAAVRWRRAHQRNQEPEEEARGWMSWCTIV